MILYCGCVFIQLWQPFPCIQENDPIARLRPRINWPHFLSATGCLDFHKFDDHGRMNKIERELGRKTRKLRHIKLLCVSQVGSEI